MNFTAAHESRKSLVGGARLAYPDRHIEADNRLSWILGRLGRAFPDDRTFYDSFPGSLGGGRVG